MSAMSNIPSRASEIQRIAAAIGAAKEYEGDGFILNDSRTKEQYIMRRRSFLGKHANFKDNTQLFPQVFGHADQVFKLEAELSVQKIRNLELAYLIDPILPFPTSTNTQTIDNFASYGPKEWTAETGHPKPKLVSSTPEPSPRMSAMEPTISNANVERLDTGATFELGESVAADNGYPVHVGQVSRQRPQTVFAGPDPDRSTQQTSANTFSDSFKQGSASHLPKGMAPTETEFTAMVPTVKNAPANPEIVQHIVRHLGSKGEVDFSHMPGQYQAAHPQLLSQVSAVKGRPLDTIVKSPAGGKKRPAPADLEEADADAAGETATNKPARSAPKKIKSFVTAGEDPVKPPVRRPIAVKEPRRATTAAATETSPTPALNLKYRDPSVASSVSNSKTAATGTRSTLGGKSLPQQAGNPPPGVPRRPSHPATVNGSRMPKTKTEAAEAAVERRQALLTNLLSKKHNIRHPDLGPEFFDIANFTEAEKGDPVRCVCGNKNDTGTNTDWVGCDNVECGVWQHVKCMGEAAKTAFDKGEEGKYLCQQCDPWAHRRLIQNLRKGQPLP